MKKYLVPGLMLVAVIGLTVAGSVSAQGRRDTMIKPGERRLGDPATTEIIGNITAVSGNTVTVNGIELIRRERQSTTTYTVDATNSRVMKDRATTTVGALAVGDQVSVRGKVSGTSVTAKSIQVITNNLPAGRQLGRGEFRSQRPGWASSTMASTSSSTPGVGRAFLGRVFNFFRHQFGF